MMTPRKQALIDNLTTARTRILGLFEQIGEHSEEQLYSDGAAWTLRQLAIHLMISDSGVSKVIQGIANGQNPIPADYDIDRYNKASVAKRPDITVDQAIEGLKQSRADFLAWLEGVDDAVLDIEGRHPLLQVLPISQFLVIMAAHDHQHADDIENFL